MPGTSSRFPARKPLSHSRAFEPRSGSIYFITLCAVPRGVNTLACDTVAPSLWQNVCFCHERGDWFPLLFLVMPDHVHGLFSFPPEGEMRQSVNAWKKFTAHALSVEWQRDFFDHRLRSDESFEEKAAYIGENPVRASLCETAEAWPYVWRMNRYG